MGLTEQSLRYLAVTVLGLAVDMLMAMAMVWSGAPRPIASACGLFIGAMLNFLLHRAWTFRDAAPPALVAQLIRYGIAFGMTLSIRLVVLVILHIAFPRLGDAAALLLATGISFSCNFVLLRHFVFLRRIAS